MVKMKAQHFFTNHSVIELPVEPNAVQIVFFHFESNQILGHYLKF